MAAPLPSGLISVTLTSPGLSSLPASDPADVLQERAHIFHNFWKVHAVKSRVDHDASAVRSRDMFWRIWGDPRLSRSVTTPVLLNLWTRCQQEFDLTPFSLPSRYSLPKQIDRDDKDDPRPSREREQSSEQGTSSSPSVSPTTSSGPSARIPGSTWGSTAADADNDTDPISEQNFNSTDNTSRSSGSRPPLSRNTTSTRKRTSFVASNTRPKTRPQMGRRKSSQTPATTQSTDSPKSPRPALKSPRPSATACSETEEQPRAITRSIMPPPGLPVPSNITSTFELPSVSSWQSEDSASGDVPSSSRVTIKEPLETLIQKDFREKFAENQKLSRSSTNLAAMDKIKKTGSVVRFADEVHQELRKGKGKAKEQEEEESSDEKTIGHLQHRGSVSSVAAFSDDGSDEGITLPRTKSQLSLLISNLRKQSGNQDLPPASLSQATSTPQKTKKQREEDQLLAMGRKGGVTKAGGVQVPRQMRLSGEPQEDFETPEEPLF